METEGVSESCRSSRAYETGGGASQGKATPGASAEAALQESGWGYEVNEGALWRCYQMVAPYLKE